MVIFQGKTEKLQLKDSIKGSEFRIIPITTATYKNIMTS